MIFEHGVDKTLVSGVGVFQSEWHNVVAVDTTVSDERRLLLIFMVHEYLVAFGEGIHECQKLMSVDGVDDSVNVRQWERIFPASFVKIGEIDANSSLFVIFPYNNDVS